MCCRFAASRFSVPSPDGRLIATLLPDVLEFTSVKTLQLVRAIPLSFDETRQAQVWALVWSASSRRVLVAQQEQVDMFCVDDAEYRAVLRLPSVPGTRPVLARFGGRDTEVCVCTAFGLKLALFNVATSTSVEIVNPKLYHPSSVSRGVSFRPDTAHLAVLTRTNGKDVISVHEPLTHEVQTSWLPDTVDAQSIEWTPDGRWLVVAESAAHGKKLLLYAPDGNLFRDWPGLVGVATLLEEAKIDGLGAGIRHVHVKRGKIAVCDHSRRITVLDAASGSEMLTLVHPTVIQARDTLQVWQERLIGTTHVFNKVAQTISPPSSRTTVGEEAAAGCSASALDASGTLLVSRHDQTDSTLWIWDVNAAELRAVLVFCAPVTAFSWHTRIPELITVACAGDAHKDVVFVWDPRSQGPQVVDFGGLLAGGGGGGGSSSSFSSSRMAVARPVTSWIDIGGDTPALQVGDGSRHVLLALGRPEDMPAAWAEGHGAGGVLDYGSGR